jgi:hypothetical protein
MRCPPPRDPPSPPPPVCIYGVRGKYVHVRTNRRDYILTQNTFSSLNFLNISLIKTIRRWRDRNSEREREREEKRGREKKRERKRNRLTEDLPRKKGKHRDTQNQYVGFKRLKS